MAQYIYGRRKELQVGEFLERRGFRWRRSPGSRTPIDLIAQRDSYKLLIQVKATRRDHTSYSKLSIDEENFLINAAKKFKAKPVLALVTKNYCWVVSVPNDKVIFKGELKGLSYKYYDR